MRAWGVARARAKYLYSPGKSVTRWSAPYGT